MRRKGTTLSTFGRCFIAQAHDIFNKIPEDITQRGVENGWKVWLGVKLARSKGSVIGWMSSGKLHRLVGEDTAADGGTN